MTDDRPTDGAAQLRTEFADDPLACSLVDVMTEPTGLSSAGYPYLDRRAWESFRDRVPHILAMGLETLRTSLAIRDAAAALGDVELAANVERAQRVVRQVVFTATITAPPDLWLLRHVLGAFAELGLLDRLRSGEALYPSWCFSGGQHLEPRELETDLHFLLARGIVEQYDNSFRLAGHPSVLDIAERATPLPAGVPAGVTQVWRRFFAGEDLSDPERMILRALGTAPPRRTDPRQNHWVPTLDEIETGYRLLPVALGMRASGLTAKLASARSIDAADLHPSDPETASAALRILESAGWLEGRETFGVTETGERGLKRGPGPFGIIEAYNPYMSRAAALLQGTGGDVWVRRSENVGASQDANRGTFQQANDAVDRFCADTGFSFHVFVEHAIGRGEATRQRFERSGDDDVRYFGADLEDPAIDAALEEQRRGALPQNMIFVRNADIGEPEILLQAIRAEGIDPYGAVMLVGNGFHEVRDQTDARMVEVFRGYHEAGLILVFTEENALSVDDLRATAFNTYHAGFKYVHEKSGQGLRPAHPRPVPRLGQELRAPWSVCATRAGYVRLEQYCSRARTIYPYTPPGGHNPCISVGHFVVPRSIADTLGIVEGSGD